MADISEYIEVFYNRQRRQAALGYLSPAVFVKKELLEKRLPMPLSMASEFDDLPHLRSLRDTETPKDKGRIRRREA
jgi:hypothetical protein